LLFINGKRFKFFWLVGQIPTISIPNALGTRCRDWAKRYSPPKAGLNPQQIVDQPALGGAATNIPFAKKLTATIKL
jgi:hypothetical protein